VSGFINAQDASTAYGRLMTTTATSFETANTSLSAVIDAVPADAWSQPSPCEGWSARDVVRHLIDTERDFFTKRDLDLGEAPDVDGDPAAAWREHSQRVSALLADESVTATEYDGHFGPTTIGATVEQFYVFDLMVHRWDIARAAGLETHLSDAELDRIEKGADSFGDAIYMDGVCKPGVEAAPEAPREVRVLARLGRRA
jgi:uncharacterized protein (TIGR03086 family)